MSHIAILLHFSLFKVRLCTLIFQASLDTELASMEFSTVKDIALDLDNWSGYRIARSAARYGQHRLATSIYQVLTSKVSVGEGVVTEGGWGPL